MQPLVSVLLPAYRAQSSIEAAVRSVFEGGLPAEAIEILIESDDGQSYEQLKILPSVKIACSGAVGSGVGAARNRALLRARGQYITYLDADDLWHKDWLSALLPLAQLRGAAVSPLQVIENNSEILTLWQDQNSLGFADAALSGASMRGLIARELFLPFAEAPSQDIDHMLSIMAACGGQLPLSHSAYCLRVQRGSVTAAQDFSARVDQAYRSYIRLYEKENAPFAKERADVFRAKIDLNAAYEAQGQGESYYRFIARRLAKSKV